MEKDTWELREAQRAAAEAGDAAAIAEYNRLDDLLNAEAHSAATDALEE